MGWDHFLASNFALALISPLKQRTLPRKGMGHSTDASGQTSVFVEVLDDFLGRIDSVCFSPADSTSTSSFDESDNPGIEFPA
mmetsp:Transcript_1609/g.3343  ORF Transcript_1609/g.3343 Transcript_1609/m.3343 type:complete len:82 (-) Transcript_1609:186-431(-)